MNKFATKNIGRSFIMSSEKTKILLVDDEPDILEFISYNLNKEGFEVFTSNNGRDAIKIAVKEKPELIILDVMMPDLDGIETCRVIREDRKSVV
jgi:two-component system alkaline phosphatase synthesis response regulator PhoP